MWKCSARYSAEEWSTFRSEQIASASHLGPGVGPS